MIGLDLVLVYVLGFGSRVYVAFAIGSSNNSNNVLQSILWIFRQTSVDTLNENKNAAVEKQKNAIRARPRVCMYSAAAGTTPCKRKHYLPEDWHMDIRAVSVSGFTVTLIAYLDGDFFPGQSGKKNASAVLVSLLVGTLGWCFPFVPA